MATKTSAIEFRTPWLATLTRDLAREERSGDHEGAQESRKAIRELNRQLTALRGLPEDASDAMVRRAVA